MADSLFLSGRSLAGSRRYVTVLFGDVCDSSRLAEMLEAEDFALLLEQLRDQARQIVARHGGVIARMQGDGVLALFGHLEPREDDGRRAAEAALELHAVACLLRAKGRGVDEALRMHSGIHGGLVLLLEGDIERGRWDVVGEVPNSASRLCSLARPGEVLVSKESLGPQAHFFEVNALHQVSLRGRSAPLDVVRVLARAAVARRIDAAALRGVVTLQGREAELGQLQSALQRAAGGATVAVLISGEPGIGKTRLIDEFVRTAAFDCRVLRGHCEGYLGTAPLQPFRLWVRELLATEAAAAGHARSDLHAGLAALAGDAAPGLAGVVEALTEDAPAAPARLRVGALVELLERAARRSPLLLVLDDWQWADDATRHALELLRERRLPMLLLLASRPFNEDDLALVGAEWLALQPLHPASAEAVVAAWLPGADPFVIQEVLRHSGGSPLFIEELCHAAAAGSALPRSGGPRASVAWLSALVASRLARLPTEQADTVRRAAVAGVLCTEGMLRQLTQPHENAALDAVLAAEDFIVRAGPGGLLRFRHGLTHAAVYDTVEPVQRRELHHAVALQYESARELPAALDRLEALAYHFEAAGEPERAASYAEQAGDRALSAMALDRARAHYTAALSALQARAMAEPAARLHWCGLVQRLGQTCVFDPLDVAAVLQHFDQAAQMARDTGDENVIARAQYWLAYVNYGKGRPGLAVRHAEAALVHAQASDDQRLVAQVQATLAQSLASAGRYEHAMPLFEQAVHSKRQQSAPGSTAAIGLAYTLGRIGYTLGDLGRFDEAQRHFDDAFELLDGKVHSVRASVLELVCAVQLWQGRWQEAHHNGLAGAELALRCRSRYLTMMGRALGACGEWAQRRDAATLRRLAEATYWIEERGGAVSTSLNYGWLVQGSAELGLETDLRRHAVMLFKRAREQDRHGEAMGCRALALHAGQQGHADLARRYLARAERAAAARGSVREMAMNALALAEVALLANHSVKARDAAQRAAEAFVSMKMDWHTAQAERVLQRV